MTTGSKHTANKTRNVASDGPTKIRSEVQTDRCGPMVIGIDVGGRLAGTCHIYQQLLELLSDAELQLLISTIVYRYVTVLVGTYRLAE